MPPVLFIGIPGGVEMLVVTVALPLGVAALVYRDATDRDSHHALAWAVASFFGSIVVWLLYWVVRDEVGGDPA